MNVYFLTALAAATAIGLVALLLGYGPRRSLGVGLVAWPFARLAVNVGANWATLVGFEVLDPIPAAALWRAAGRSLFHNALIPLAGLALYTGAIPAALRVARIRPRESWGRDALNALALLPVVAGGYVLTLLLLTSGFANRLVNGDESQVFAEMTPTLAVAVSLSAGLAEEILYRGILLGLLLHLLPPLAAVGLQSVAFGFAHAGYGTWAHVLGPAVFGLFMAWVTFRVGLFPAMILHAGINVVFFSIDMRARHPEAAFLLAGLALASLVALRLVRLAPFRAMIGRPIR